MTKQHMQHISLDEVVAGRFPERVLAQIENIQLTVEEMAEWEKSKPAFRFVLTENQLDFMVRKRIRWNSKRAKVIAASIAAIAGGAWSFIQYIYPSIS